MKNITEELKDEELSKLSCQELIELAQILDVFDEKLNKIIRIIRERCSARDLANLKQLIKIKLMANEYYIPPEFISLYGTDIAYLISQLLDFRIGIRSFQRQLIKFLRIVGEKDKWGLSVIEPTDEDSVFELALIFVSILDKLGLLEEKNFRRLFLEAARRSATRLDLKKSIITTAVLIYNPFVTKDELVRYFRYYSKNFLGLKGVATCIGLAILRYFMGDNSLPSLSTILEALNFDMDGVIIIYELAKAGNRKIIHVILNQIISMYFEGNVNSVLEDILRGAVEVDYVFKALLSTSFATLSVDSLETLLTFLVNVAKTSEVKVSTVFELLVKIIQEVQPVVLRKFLMSEKSRSLLATLIQLIPEMPVILMVSKMISIFVPYSYVDQLRGKHIGLNIKMGELGEILPYKVKVYLGVVN